MEPQKNMKIRKAMFVACMNQRELASLLGETEGTISVILRRFELSKAEQDSIVQKIRQANTEPF